MNGGRGKIHIMPPCGDEAEREESIKINVPINVRIKPIKNSLNGKLTLISVGVGVG